MMPHLSEQDLERFTLGRLDEDAAVAFAVHIDGCPHCASRAASAEPLGPMIAAMDDPEVPDDLVDAILHEARQASLRPRRRVPVLPVVAAVALMAAAALLMVLGGEPAGLVSEAASTAQAFLVGLGALAGQITLLPVGAGLVFGLLIFGGCIYAARRFGGRQRWD